MLRQMQQQSEPAESSFPALDLATEPPPPTP
jgi:hypothetical protein